MEKIKIEDENSGRLDVFLRNRFTDISRSRLASLIKEGIITVNAKKVKPGYALDIGDEIDVIIPEDEPLNVVANDIPLDIVYEDHDIVVVNKPRGMVVHPAPGNEDNTLVNALLAHCTDLSGINGVLRPGIVHRIDKDTSGLLLVAKNDKAHVNLAAQLKEHSIHRVYQGIVIGEVAEPKGIVDCPIGRHPSDRKKYAVTDKNSKNAVTHYSVLERFPGYTLIEAQLETGRTHQIRVHMKYVGYTLLGDPLYGKGDKNPFHFQGQALHAAELGFIHPTNNQYMEFKVPVPADMENVLKELRKSH
ncbi:MAG: RluA family pseudouridine synthase [Clostridiales bacterium]